MNFNSDYLARGILFGAAILSGCTVERDDALSSDTVDGSRVSLSGALEFDDCSSTHRQMLTDALMIGLVTAQDSVFEACVLNAPYIPCDDDDDPRATTAVQASQSPNDVRMRCESFNDGITGGQAGPNHGPLHNKEESFSVAKEVLENSVGGQIRGVSGVLSQIIWHEVIHTHDFNHGAGKDSSTFAAQCGRDPKTWSASRNSMPNIVGDCMRSTLEDLVDRRFRRDFGRNARVAEHNFFYGEMASGNITTPVALTHAITDVAAPTDLRAGNVTPTSIRLEWNDNSANEDRFEIVGSRGFSSLFIPDAGEDQMTATASNLEPGVAYTFKVRACNPFDCSDYTPEIVVQTTSAAPSVPENVRVGTIESTRVELLWDPPLDNGHPTTHYYLWWTGGSPSRTRFDAIHGLLNRYWVEHLDPNESYLFNLQACNTVDCSTSVFRTARTQRLAQVPRSLSNLRITSNTLTEVSLAWDDPNPSFVPVSEEWEVELHWTAAGSGSPTVVPLAYGPTQHTFQKPFGGTIYQILIRACNIGGCSDFTNQVSAF